MASKQREKKSERFSGTDGTASRSNASGNQASEKSNAPAAHRAYSKPREAPVSREGNDKPVHPAPAARIPFSQPHETTVKKNKQPGPSAPAGNDIKKPPSPAAQKQAPLRAPSRHAWAPPQLPFARDIPSLYHETYVRMIPRGPHHVFSFWEIGGDDIRKVKDHPSGPAEQPVLRLYAINHKGGKKAGAGMTTQRIGNIAVPPGIRSHYVRVPESGLTYRMDLGIMTPSGRFISVCQSNEAATPRARVAPAKTTGTGRQNGPEETAIRKLIDFSLLSGRMIAEADRPSGTLFIDGDEPFAVEPDKHCVEGHAEEHGTTVSSWR